MSDRYPRIRLHAHFEGERYLVIRDGLNITFYMRRPHHELRHGVVRAVETYRGAVGANALGSYLNYEGEWEDLDERGWAFVGQELLRPEGARITLGDRRDATAGCEINYIGRPFDSPEYDALPGEVSVLSCWLPTEYLEEHGPGHVRELALQLGAELPFNSGHAGLAFFYNEALLGMTRHVREHCFQYPGLDISDLSNTNLKLGTRINGAQWLTFLGQPVLGALGGAAGLRSRLHSPETTVQELEGGRAVVTLGSWPEAGDKDPEHTLAPYRELARVLEPWLYLDRGPWRGFSQEDLQRWARRFLG